MADTKNVIMAQGIDTYDAWSTQNTPLEPGELSVVKIVTMRGDYIKLIKVGDVSSNSNIEFNNLPYVTTGAFDENSSSEEPYNPHTGEIYNDYKNNVASGLYSHAQNRGTSATGKYSTAVGLSTNATGDAQTALGKYNATKNDALVVVGNGTSALSRSNIIAVTPYTLFVYGGINASGAISVGAIPDGHIFTVNNDQGTNRGNVTINRILYLNATSTGNAAVTYDQMVTYVSEHGGGGGGGSFQNPIKADLGINKSSDAFTTFGIKYISYLSGMGVGKVIRIDGNIINDNQGELSSLNDNTYLVKRNIVALIDSVGLKSTSERSIILNQIEDNPSTAIGKNNILGGNGNSAGSKAFEIIGYKYKVGNSKIIYRVSNKNSEGETCYSSASELSAIKGKYCTLKIDYNIPHFCKILETADSITVTSDYIDIEVDKFFCNDSGLIDGKKYIIGESFNDNAYNKWIGTDKRGLIYNTYNLAYAIANRSVLTPKKHMLLVESEISLEGVKSDMSGYGTFIANENTTVFGGDNLVQGDYSLVSGVYNSVFGRYSMAIGSYNKVGYTGFVIGNQSNNYALNSLIVGDYNTAYFNDPEIDESQTNGIICVGMHNDIHSAYSGAIGTNLVTSNNRQLVIGRANAVDLNQDGTIAPTNTKKLFDVGNGEVDSYGQTVSRHSVFEIEDTEKNAINVKQKVKKDAVLIACKADTDKNNFITTFDNADKGSGTSETINTALYHGRRYRTANGYLDEVDNTNSYTGYLRYPIKCNGSTSDYKGLFNNHLVVISFTIEEKDPDVTKTAEMNRLFYDKTRESGNEQFINAINLNTLNEGTHVFGFFTGPLLNGDRTESVGIGLQFTQSATATWKIHYNYMNIYKLINITAGVMDGEIFVDDPNYYMTNELLLLTATTNGIFQMSPDYNLGKNYFLEHCDKSGILSPETFIQKKIIRAKESAQGAISYYAIGNDDSGILFGSTKYGQTPYIYTNADSGFKIEDGTIKNLEEPFDTSSPVTVDTLSNIFDNKSNYIEFKATLSDDSVKEFLLFGKEKN